ncbi:MAG: PIN domain-containing protein [Solirubrobacterales bacterium]|nr:PIN domain-containing protein [Solirubrobacterales bacterium]
MAVALDSNVVIGFLDRSDGFHHAADKTIRELLASEQLVVSAVTYAEVLTGARLGHHDEDVVKGFFADLISRIIPVDVAVGDAAARIRAGAKALAMPDALVAATAELDPEVELLLTADEDMAKLKHLDCPLRLLSPDG